MGRITRTDEHWGGRARSVENDAEVNIMDVFQRELEYEHIERFLSPEQSIAEVGCGNGYSTDRFRKKVKHVDAFDYSADMIRRAKEVFGEKNNRFLHDDVLEPKQLGQYDVVLCVRVLINLRDEAEQLKAIRNLARMTKPGGRLLLVEGFTDGFDELTRVRARVGLPPVEPAKINVYLPRDKVQPELDRHFTQVTSFHLGLYDVLTRVLYPLLAGEQLERNTLFHEKCSQLARSLPADLLAACSRIQGLVLERRPAGA